MGDRGRLSKELNSRPLLRHHSLTEVDRATEEPETSCLKPLRGSAPPPPTVKQPRRAARTVGRSCEPVAAS